MATIPVAGQIFTFDVSVVSQANQKIFQVNPTLTAADWNRSINGGAMTALDNTPTVVPASSRNIRIVLSAAETTAAGAGGDIQILGSDAVGAEWCDISIGVRIAVVDAGALADDAITLSKFDESTAWPLVAADSGVTQVARVGADGDTLETLSDQIDVAQADLDTPAQYKADVSALATSAEIAALNDPSAADVADAVWDEAIVDHATPGTAGAAINRIGSAQITTTSPVATSGDVEITQGYDYDADDGYALEWTDSVPSWPDLTGATITFIIENQLSKAGLCTNPGETNQIIRVELTDTETLALTPGKSTFVINGTLPSGNVILTLRGTITIIKRTTASG